MSPNLALLPPCSEGRIVVKERDGGTTKRYMMIAISTFGVDGREIPDSDGQLSVCGDGAVVDW
jgi:hypothetical protein